MTNPTKAMAKYLLCFSLFAVSGCNSTTGSAEGSASSPTTVANSNPTTTVTNTGSGTTTTTSTSTNSAGSQTNNGTSSNPVTAPTLQNTSLAPSTAVVLTLDTGTNTVGSLAGTYTHSTGQVVVGGSNFAVNANGNSYVGSVTGGGNNQVVALPTLAADMPTSGTATYNGTADIAYLDTPSGRLFDGTMNAQVTATFANPGGTVDIILNTPNGTFGGANYTGPGQATIAGLVTNGATYTSAAGSTSSVTGFTGATGLNSGAQTVAAQGVFGGPAADETGATAVIQDGVNGQALISLTAR